MAAIASTIAVSGIFPVTEAVLTADDTITIAQGKKQLLILRNDTAGALTATLDGDAGTTVNVPGMGVVSVAAGLALAVPANSVRAVVLSTVSAYCQGVVHLLGGTGLKVQLVNL